MKRYVARISDNLGKLHDYILSKSFDTILDCQHFIDTDPNIILIETLLSEAFRKIILNYYIDDKRKMSLCFGGRFIRVYDNKQKRFIDGFDL